ncbi:MAG: hypothetical protein WDM81_13265 [Rhizomicrobium sp.]
MPNSDIEVFDHLTSDDTTPEELDFLAYAIFAFKKKEWCDHFEKTKGHKPTHDEIDEWISQLPDFEFDQIRSDAANFFHSAAEEHLREYIEAEKKRAVDESIMGAVKSATSWERHISIALGMAILAPIVLGGIVFLFTYFDHAFPVHVSFGSDQPSTQSSGASNTPSAGAK